MTHKTYHEISSQYIALKQTHKHLVSQRGIIKDFFNKAQAKRILIIGSGSSYYIGKSIQMYVSIYLETEANCIPAGDFMLHPEKYAPLMKDAIVLALSRSGATHEILFSIQEARKLSTINVFSIVCASNTKLSEVSDYSIELPWAFDESICQTRSVTNIFVAARLLVAILSDDKETISDIKLIAEQGNTYIKSIESKLSAIAKEDWSNVFVLADGEVCGVAEEAALALTEISYTKSDYSHVLDVRHGPILLVGKQTLVLALLGTEKTKHQQTLIQDLINRGAKVIVLHDNNYKHIEGTCLEIMLKGGYTSSFGSIYLLLVAQLLAYYKAIENGLDPDQPAGLDAWISLD